MAESNKKNVFLKNLDLVVLLIITAVISLCTFTGFFQKLDYRVYDLELSIKKAPVPDKRILFVNIDNESIETMGAWPWSRDILADSLLRMKELGATGAVFDIEYLSPSNLGVAPDSKKQISAAFSAAKSNVFETINELTSAVSEGQIQRTEINDISKTMLDDYISPEFDNLYSSITSSIYRDNDDYFARSIQFFGNAWLTVNIRNIAINTSEKDMAYVRDRFLLKNVTDKDNLILKNNKYSAEAENAPLGFSPALHAFLSHAAGAGFTNIIIDSDGTRRRVELLAAQKDSYAGQLIFAPALNLLKPEQIIRKGNKLILEQVTLDGSGKKKDIVIPLDNHGRMMVNWIHEPFEKSFRKESVQFLKQLDSMESNIVDALEVIQSIKIREQNGADLSCVSEANTLLKQYAQITAMKRKMLGQCKGYDEKDAAVDGGISQEEYDSYFTLRKAFYTSVKKFIDAKYDQSVYARLDQIRNDQNSAQIENFHKTIASVFETLNSEDSLYEQYTTEMKASYKDSFCIIGNTASSTTDLGVTPFESKYPNVGTHANVFNTVITHDFITPLNGLWGFAAAFLFSLLYILLTRKSAVYIQNIAGIALIICTTGIILLLFILCGWYIPIVSPALLVIFNYLAITILHFVSSERDKRFLRQAFSTYLSKDVVNQIVEDPEKLRLGGEEKHITALFTDIKSFSSFSEMVTPTKLVSVLNVYLGMLSDTILAHNGTIDKYIGDEIVSFFGAPLDIPDHAYLACSAGVRMKQAEKLYNKEHLASGDIPRSLETRVGINTGDMVVGNMGTDLKLNYTIMGNDVNLASRLEGVNKVYGSWVLASEMTWNEADTGAHKGTLVARRFDKVRVIGINKPVQLYNIVGFRSEMSKDELEAIDIFHAGLDRYLVKDFTGAKKLFEQAHALQPEDGAPPIFAQRCTDFIKNGVAENWDGVMNMTSK